MPCLPSSLPLLLCFYNSSLIPPFEIQSVSSCFLLTGLLLLLQNVSTPAFPLGISRDPCPAFSAPSYSTPVNCYARYVWEASVQRIACFYYYFPSLYEATLFNLQYLPCIHTYTRPAFLFFSFLTYQCPLCWGGPHSPFAADTPPHQKISESSQWTLLLPFLRSAADGRNISVHQHKRAFFFSPQGFIHHPRGNLLAQPPLNSLSSSYSLAAQSPFSIRRSRFETARASPTFRLGGPLHYRPCIGFCCAR